MIFRNFLIEYCLFIFVLLALASSPYFSGIDPQTGESVTTLQRMQNNMDQYTHNLLYSPISLAVGATIIFGMLLFSRPFIAAIYMLVVGSINIFIGANLGGIIPDMFIIVLQFALSAITFFSVVQELTRSRSEPI